MKANKYLTKEELNNLKHILGKYSKERDAIMIQVALATGARASELLSIKQSDLSDDQHAIYLRTLKGGPDRMIPIKKELFQQFKALGPIPFPITYNRLVQIWYNYRPVKKNFHSLRHSFAMNLYDRSKNVRLVQRALGHKYLSTTEIYLQYTYTVNEMKKALLIK